MKAAEKNDTEAVKFLLDKGADLDKRDERVHDGCNTHGISGAYEALLLLIDKERASTRPIRTA